LEVGSLEGDDSSCLLSPALSLRMQSQIAALNEININFYEFFSVNEKRNEHEEIFSLVSGP